MLETVDRYRRVLLAVICFGVAFVLYLRTLAPTVYTFDSAEFATGAFTLGIIHSTGYPLYLLIAKGFTLLPVGDVAYRVNLLSAVAGAVTIALLSLLCYRLTGRFMVAALVSLLYAFSHYFWPEALIAETYTLNTTLIVILVLLLTRPKSYLSLGSSALAGLTLGLALANHMSSILTLPALLYWGIVRRDPRIPIIRYLFSFALSALIGLLFYLYLPIRYAADPPLNYAKTYFGVDLTTLRGIWAWVSGEMFRPYMLGYDIASIGTQVMDYVSWLWTNFIGAGVVLGLLGIYQMLRRESKLFGFCALLYLAYTIFFINYDVVNKDTMFSVSYLVWTIWIAYGAKALDEWLSPESDYPVAARPAHLRKHATAALLASVAVLALVVNYSWADQSHNRQAREFAGGLLANVQPSAFIITEWTWATPLEYLQIVEQRRPDVTIFDRGLYGLAVWNQLRAEQLPDSQALEEIDAKLADLIRRALVSRPVYATAYDELLAREFAFIPEGAYYRLEWRR